MLHIAYGYIIIFVFSFSLLIPFLSGGMREYPVNYPPEHTFAVDSCIGGGNCLIQSGSCVNIPCLNGECQQIEPSYYRCFCRVGYSGVHCNVEVNECSLGLCRNNASCLNRALPDSFFCLCPETFTGVYCEIPVDVCQSGTCLNGGICQADPTSGFRCTCPNGLTGDRCEADINECLTLRSPCAGKGTCRNTLGGYECDCLLPYYGDRCENAYCASQTMNACLNGRCLVDGNTHAGYRCNCSTGFTGEFCDENIDDCVGVTCSGRGICVDEIAEYRCLCLPGWTGRNCETRVDECSNNECLNGATCLVNPDGGYRCQCRVGFGGQFCQTLINPCLAAPCGTHGSCLNATGTSSYVCRCRDGWTGFNCTERGCLDGQCLNGGTCRVDGDGPVCQCSSDWLGVRCELPKNPCLSTPCRNDGLCVARDTTPMPPTAPIVTDPSGRFDCFCQPDFGGHYCEIRIDDCKGISRCLNGGTCLDGVANYTCQCPPQFTGWHCDIRQPARFPLMTLGITSTALTDPPMVIRTTVSSTVLPTLTITTAFPILPSTSTGATTKLTTATTTTRTTTTTTTTRTAVTSPATTRISTTTEVSTTARTMAAPTISTTTTRTLLLAPVNSLYTASSVLASSSSATSSVTIQRNIPVDINQLEGVEGALAVTPAPTNQANVRTTYSTQLNPSNGLPIRPFVVIRRTPPPPTSTVASTTVTPTLTTIANTHQVATVTPATTTSTAVGSTGLVVVRQISSAPMVQGTMGAAICAEGICRNGGTCRITDSGQFGCDCPLRYFGDLCEDEVLITRPAFSGDGWLRYPGVSLGSSAQLEVALRFLPDLPVKTNSMVFYAYAVSSREGVRMELLNETAIRLNSSCGEGHPLTLTVAIPRSATTEFTTVTFRQQFPMPSRPVCSAYLSWGSSVTQSSLSLADVTQTTSVLEALYIGGYPNAIANFSGVISNMVVGGEEYKFDVSETPSVTGVNVLQASRQACAVSPCRNGGICLELVTGWMCACPVEFAGILCELPSCSSNPCLAGSTCVPSTSQVGAGAAIQCICPVGRYGMYCENSYMVGSNLRYFGRSATYSSYTSFAPIETSGHHLDITFNFSSTIPGVSASGWPILLLLGRQELIHQGFDYILVGLQGDLAVLLYNLGGGIVTVGSPTRIDGRVVSHRLHVMVDSVQGVSITLDSATAVVSPHPAGYTFTNLDEHLPVSVGGYDILDVLPLSLQAFTSFNGTITDLKFRTTTNGTFTPFSQVIGGRNVLPADVDNLSPCGPANIACGGQACFAYGASYGCGCGHESDSASSTGYVCAALSVCRSARNRCQQKDQCVPDFSVPGEEYRCDCPLGRRGKSCDIDSNMTDVPSFNGINSYLVFPPTPVLRYEAKIQVQIRPRSSSGLIAYVSQLDNSRSSEFFSLFLSNWTVNLRFNLGDSITKSITNTNSLNGHANQWSSVEAGRNGTAAWLSVNGSTVSTTLTSSALRSLDVFTNLCVGGIPGWFSPAESSVVENTGSFNGCLADISVNDRPYHLDGRLATGGLNVETCDTRMGDPATGDQVRVNSCRNNSCRNGSDCASDPVGTGYTCDCRIGQVGRFCETESSKNTTSMTFQKDSYLLLSSQGYETSDRSANFLSFRFRTSLPDCLLMWTGKITTPHSDYLGVGLRSGHLLIAWNLGWTSKRTILTVSSARFDDDHWHQVTITRQNSDLSATISTTNGSGGLISINGTTAGLYTALETGGLYYLGSFPRDDSVSQATLDLFANPFVGCLANISFSPNSNSLLLSDALDGRNVQPCTSNF